MSEATHTTAIYLYTPSRNLKKNFITVFTFSCLVCWTKWTNYAKLKLVTVMAIILVDPVTWVMYNDKIN